MDKIPTWQTFDAWDDTDARLDPFEIDGVRLVMVCQAFPEAYDAFLDGTLIGYLKVRYGHFFAKYPDVNGEVVYDVHPGDSYGMFTPEERVEHLPRAIAALKERHGRAPE